MFNKINLAFGVRDLPTGGFIAYLSCVPSSHRGQLEELTVSCCTMAFFGASSTAANVSSAPEKDVEVADPPPDSISSLAFCPVADFLAVGSWDNNVSQLLICLFTLVLMTWLLS